MRLYGARPHDAGELEQVDRPRPSWRSERVHARPRALRCAEHAAQRLFARHLNRSAIAVTEGLLRQLTMREIAAVLAREVSHVGFGDLYVLSIADWVTRAAQAALLCRAGARRSILCGITGEEPVSWLTVALCPGAAPAELAATAAAARARVHRRSRRRPDDR